MSRKKALWEHPKAPPGSIAFVVQGGFRIGDGKYGVLPMIDVERAYVLRLLAIAPGITQAEIAAMLGRDPRYLFDRLGLEKPPRDRHKAAHRGHATRRARS